MPVDRLPHRTTVKMDVPGLGVVVAHSDDREDQWSVGASRDARDRIAVHVILEEIEARLLDGIRQERETATNG